MKRKDYQMPTMKVVELRSKCQILAGSDDRKAALDDYEVQEKKEW